MTKILIGLFLLFALEFYTITIAILYFSKKYFNGIKSLKKKN